MNKLIDRLVMSPKTSSLGLLSIAGVVFGVLSHNHPQWMWLHDAIGITTGLTLLAMRDARAQ